MFQLDYDFRPIVFDLLRGTEKRLRVSGVSRIQDWLPLEHRDQKKNQRGKIDYRRRCQECYRFRVIEPARHFVCRSAVDRAHTGGGRCRVGRVNQADVCCLQLKKINTITGQHWPVELT